MNITVLSIFSSVAKCCEDSIFNYSSREKVLSPVIHSYTLIIKMVLEKSGVQYSLESNMQLLQVHTEQSQVCNNHLCADN